MKFLEKNLEDIIWEVYQEGRMEELARRGLEIDGKLFRQFPLGNYGVADLIEIKGEDDDVYSVTIFELKQSYVDEKTLSQACRYLTALKSIFGLDTGIEFRIVLIGSEINVHSNFLYLLNEMDFVTVYLYDYYMDGIQFGMLDNNYKIRKENFARNTKDILSSVSVNESKNNPTK